MQAERTEMEHELNEFGLTEQEMESAMEIDEMMDYAMETLKLEIDKRKKAANGGN